MQVHTKIERIEILFMTGIPIDPVRKLKRTKICYTKILRDKKIIMVHKIIV